MLTSLGISDYYGILTGADAAVFTDENFANLRHLGIASNDLSGPIPADLGWLTKLTLIDLGGNLLTRPL